MFLRKVEQLMGNNFTVAEEAEIVDSEEKLSTESFAENFISKSRIGMDLIRMGVKVCI